MMKKIVSGLLIFATYWSMFVPFAATAQTVGAARNKRMENLPEGLAFRLSEGSKGAESRVEQKLKPTDPISDDAARDLLKRLPGAFERFHVDWLTSDRLRLEDGVEAALKIKP